MKIFANTNIWKKLVIILTVIFSLSFVAPKQVEAGVGGELMRPVCSFLVGIGDGFMDVLHRFLIGQEHAAIKVNMHEGVGWMILRIVATIAVAAIVVVATVGVAGAVMGAIAAGGTVISSIVTSSRSCSSCRNCV